MKVGLVQSMLRGAFASALFALLAVSASENAAAQTVQTCQVNLNVLLSNPIGQDPHFPTDPEILEWFELCEGESFNSGSVFNTNYNTDRCAACDFTCPFGLNVLYEVEGSSVDYCGPRSQCNAVGGTVIDSAGNPTGEICGCDTGNARIGGVCVEGQDEADCTEFQEYASSEDADRTEGACRPRVARDCDPNFQFNPAADGGTCTPCGGHQFSAGEGASCTECAADEFRGMGESCVACPVENEVRELGATECGTIPAAGGGGSSSGSSGGAVALIAVPVVLIGGYYLLGGFDYIDPVYDLAYQGENENLDWRGNAGFNLRHEGLRSYASAVQTNGGAVSYESGVSYERDFLSLTYDAAESKSEYLYDFGARAKAEFGLWAISPTAAAELQYQTGEAAWISKASAGVEAAWTAHKWLVRARSEFGSEERHEVAFNVVF